jgi:SAM-dependent methyltransferase
MLGAMVISHEQQATAVCNICGYVGAHASFPIKNRAAEEWFKLFPGPVDERESTTCNSCGSISRDRMLIWALGDCLNEKGPLCDWKRNKNIRILEGSGVRAHPAYLRRAFNYTNTRYDQRRPRWSIGREKFADFQDLQYPDNCFDFVLASDVFEHIRDDEKAFREVFRVLKPRGYLILQVPYTPARNTLVRVKLEADREVFLMPPEYHGGKTLVYRTYGKDLLENLKGIGFAVKYIGAEIPEHAINLQPLFICRKSCGEQCSQNFSG